MDHITCDILYYALCAVIHKVPSLYNRLMKYYELHENFWQQLQQKGHISWDREKKDELMSRARNDEIKKFLGDRDSGEVLDLGSGSGSQSFFLSKLGFKCSALDISQTAISIGKELAKELSLDINFICGDACSFELQKKFDVITDSCLLHCIVSDSDRINFFYSVKKHMKSDGRFFIYTMIQGDPSYLIGERQDLLFDKDGVLWSMGPDSFDVEWTKINGHKYFPHRRVLTEEQQRQELIDNGFTIEKEKIIPGREGSSALYIAWLKSDIE